LSLKSQLRTIAIPLVSGFRFKLAADSLRKMGKLPAASRNSDRIDSILFSLPYHSVGDTILALPLLDLIHETYPHAAIDFLVGAGMASLLCEIPYVPTECDPGRSHSTALQRSTRNV